MPNVPVVLFDLPAKEGDPNGIVREGHRRPEEARAVAAGDQGPLEATSTPPTTSSIWNSCAGCDLIIEAIAERMDWKNDLYARSRRTSRRTRSSPPTPPACRSTRWPKALPARPCARFCGIHFFNPPRYMHLVEIIATRDTDAGMLDNLETWLTSRLGKGVVRALDTPNFVANRVGVFSILAVMHHTQRFGLGFDEVDAPDRPAASAARRAPPTAPPTWSASTPWRTSSRPCRTRCPNDPWHKYYAAPAWLSALIAKGALGQKTRCGIFKKEGKAIQVLDLAKQDYRDSAGEVARRRRWPS
jgi:3-hydroxyacyl-CoA dehydrogenase